MTGLAADPLPRAVQPLADHRDALAAGQGADEAVAAQDQRRDHVAVLVEELHLAAGELPGGDDARGRCSWQPGVEAR